MHGAEPGKPAEELDGLGPLPRAWPDTRRALLPPQPLPRVGLSVGELAPLEAMAADYDYEEDEDESE